MTGDEDGPNHQRFVVTVDDLAGVARVINVLRGRRYDTWAINAVRRGSNGWTIELTIRCGNGVAQLLCRRFERLVDVDSARRVS